MTLGRFVGYSIRLRPPVHLAVQAGDQLPQWGTCQLPVDGAFTDASHRCDGPLAHALLGEVADDLAAFVAFHLPLAVQGVREVRRPTRETEDLVDIVRLSGLNQAVQSFKDEMGLPCQRPDAGV